MEIHLYTVSWNEGEALDFFFRHYDPWVDRFVVYDDGSTDGTFERLRAHPRVELRRFARTRPSSFVESRKDLNDEAWKESRGAADWVVVTDVDEHLHVARLPMRDYLAECRQLGVTYVPALGYQMVSEELPAPGERLCETRTLGAPFWQMNKLALFDPAAIAETRFAFGRHGARPRGRLALPARDELLLLHYRYLGFERTLARNALLLRGLGDADRAKKRGVQYLWTREELRADWDRFARDAVDISAPGFEPWRSNRLTRWWRAPLRDRAAHLGRWLERRLRRER